MRPSPCLAAAPCVAAAPCLVDRPPTHFFVKKKFIPAGDAERFGRALLRIYALRGETLCGSGSDPPPGGGSKAAPQIMD